ncbi:hypothetical protein CEY16_11340 [Halalkalibacillus sediminis]|uniref:TraB/GumN family protein n=1 Tax=Halalkalibacillus sediminis TaxID=2018042 RepID=A0A2I0QT79_9BACI|nr:TraB/GumN family protein [Halalkalibacillus sediminis]PKR77320.1 hypothetical protein CEY16_11340 [Halalkalibacillus sediminis]
MVEGFGTIQLSGKVGAVRVVKEKRILIVMVMVVGLLAACQSEETVEFSDENLEAAIADEIDNTEEDWSVSDVETVSELDLSESEIMELSGLEAFDGVEMLDLSDNDISDISVLLEMEGLKEVDLSENPYRDVDDQQEIVDQLTANEIEVIHNEKTYGRPDGPGGFLWKVENEGTTVYLQGTIHAGTRDFYPLHEKIETAYHESDVIVPEIDLNNVDMGEMQQLNNELGTYQDGTTLQDHLPEDLYKEVDQALNGFGLGVEMVEQYKPWFLSTLIQQLMMQELGYTFGVDQYFLNKANMDDKEVQDLETVEEQLGIFADTSEEYQIEMLEDSLISLEEMEEDMLEMFELYKAGDEDDLLDSLMEEEVATDEVDEEAEAFMKAINDDRNYGMAEEIEGFLENGEGQTYFVIVGSLHLILEPHIVSILEEEGYDVEKVH